MLDPFVILAPILLLPVMWLLRFIGCTSFSSSDEAAQDTVTVNPSTADLGPGDTKQFALLVNGVTVTADSWSPNAPIGFYTAPLPFNSAHTKDTVTATKGGVSGTATVNLKGLTVTVTPPATALQPGESQTFTANTAVNWSPAACVPTGPNACKYTAPAPYVLGSPPVTITATATADPGAKGTASVNLAGNGARFVTSDATTTGTWMGIYGSAGWALAGQPANLVSLPGFLPSLSLPGQGNVLSFADPTPDPRGLQKPGTANRFADMWDDANVLTVEFDFIDFGTHRIAVYFVDWDLASHLSQPRSQKIEILDTSQTPPAVLDTRNLAGFDGGQYLIWDLTGKVVLRVTRTGAFNAVISGIFFQ